MGQITSNIRAHIQSEHERLCKGKKKTLVIDEIIEWKCLDDYPVDFAHMGVALAADADRDGRFSLQDLISFAEWCAGSVPEGNDFRTELQAECSIRMREELLVPEQREVVLDWCCRLFSEDVPTHRDAMYPGVLFIRGDSIKTIHKLLNVQDAFGIDYQAFFDLMQRVAEEMGLLSLDAESLDDYVPMVVMRQFAEQFFDGFSTMMQQIGL